MKQKGLSARIKKNVKPNQIKAYISPSEALDDTFTCDVKKPLMVIRQYCRELIAKYGETLDGQYKEYLMAIDVQTIKMNEQIDIMINSPPYSRGEVHTITVDLGEMSKAIIEGLMLTNPERRVKFISAISVLANGDANLLQIVLRNLLHKAWRSTSNKDETVIELGIATCEGRTAYFIRDNGNGLEENEADELSSPKVISDDLNMYGFGLDAVKRIIHLHKGEFWLERGKGTTCYFTLE
jgi:light-regulated signal transduction histidine kinase (bacteriophytochrome)